MNHSVGDETLGKTRVLARQCATCVFRPGNPVMSPGRLETFVGTALANGTFIPCHSTYPPLGNPPTSICRGFYVRHRGTGILAVMQRLWGFVFVEPPK